MSEYSDKIADACERHADLILRASGSGLRHYTVQKTRNAILSAVIDHHEEAYRLGAAFADERAKARIAQLEGALEFYADESGWNQPPVQTVNHEIFGKAYQNQASKIQMDRGKIARQALTRAGEGKQA